MSDEQSRNPSASGWPERLTIGQIASPHGVRGEFRMYINTHFPERIPELSRVYIGDEPEPRKLIRARIQGNLAIMRVEGISSREMVDELRQTPIQIDFDDAAPLEEGEYYHFQIIGLLAFDDDGNQIGEVVDIIETGANDVYVIRGEDKRELLIPALTETVPEIDIENGRMLVRPPRYSDEE